MIRILVQIIERIRQSVMFHLFIFLQASAIEQEQTDVSKRKRCMHLVLFYGKV
jgi:hypothetical protein